MTCQTLCLLISALFLESSYAYPTSHFIETSNIEVINNNKITADLIKSKTLHPDRLSFHDIIQSHPQSTTFTATQPLENIADNSQITKSISTNAQGDNTKTYRIKRADTAPKIQDHSQTNKLNMNTMKWESELKSIELLKSSSNNSTSNLKLR